MCKEREAGTVALWSQARACLRRTPFFSTRCLEDTGVLMVFAIPPTRFSQRERRAEVEGDGGGRETQKEKTREDGAQQRSVLVCANQHTHTQWMCLASHTQREDKTRHGNGDTHTWGWMRRQDTTHKGGEREGRRQGVAQAKTLTTTQKKKKKAKRQ